MVAAVDSTDARRELPQLLGRFQQGERIVITLRRKPVAELIPTPTPAEPVASTADADQEAVQRAIAALKAARKGRPSISWREIREWVHEGRP